MDEILARLEEIETELRTIHETAGDEPFTDEQQSRWDELSTERTERQSAAEAARVAEGERLRVLAERRSTVASFAERVGATESGDGPSRTAEIMQRVATDHVEVRQLSRNEVRDRALKAMESRDATSHLSTRQTDHIDRLIRQSRSRNFNPDYLGRRLLLTENEHYRSAFVKLTTRTQPVLTEAEQRAVWDVEEFRTAMSIGTDAAGGFGVPVLIDPTIILTAQGSPNDIISLARVETITNDEWKGVTSAGVTWGFDAEATEVGDDAPVIAQPAVPTHKAQGFIPYSIEVGMDYPGFAQEMSTLLDAGYRELLSSALTTGSGSDAPTGIVTALDANTNVEVTPTTDGAFGAVDLYKLWDNLPINYRNRGDQVAWMASTDVMNEIRNFGTTLGSNFTVDLTEESLPRLFGKRFFANDHMGDFTGTTGASNLLVLGDWKNFLVAQRAGMSVELVPHLLGSNRRPSGQRGWYAWARVGADSINDLGFRLLQNA